MLEPSLKAAATAVDISVVDNNEETTSSEGRWAARPLLGGLLRLASLVLPVATALCSAMAVSRLVDRPRSVVPSIGWWALVVLVSTVVLLVADRLARRLVAVSALLRLSLAFPGPGPAPSRLMVGLRAGAISNLEQHLAWAKDHGSDEDPGPAAERILTLVGALNVHDRGTRGHSDRVRAFNDLIAESMGLPEPDRDRLRWAALVHDIGKLHVPARLLSKPGRPTGREWEQLQSHPGEGALIVAPLAGWLGQWAGAVEEHHERWDGTGYPHGLAGEDIGVAARIVAVADTFEVITAPRPYRLPVSAQAARDELARCAGSHFDPVVVRAFLDIPVGRLRRAMGPLSWLAQLPLFRSMPRLESKTRVAARSAAATAGTATGVGALAMTGILGSATAATMPASSRAPSLRDAANLFAAATNRVVPVPADGVTESGDGRLQAAPAPVSTGESSSASAVASRSRAGDELVPDGEDSGPEDELALEEDDSDLDELDLEDDDDPAPLFVPAPVLGPATDIIRDDQPASDGGEGEEDEDEDVDGGAEDGAEDDGGQDDDEDVDEDDDEDEDDDGDEDVGEDVDEDVDGTEESPGLEA